MPDRPHPADRPVDPRLAELASAGTLVVTTFRRDRRPVPTPVWAALVEAQLYFTAPANTGKVKRLRHTPAVSVAAGTTRGEPTGDAIAAIASPVEDEATRTKVRNALAERHPIGHRLISATYRLRRVPTVTYQVVLTPTA